MPRSHRRTTISLLWVSLMITSVRYLSLFASLTALAAAVPAVRSDGPAGSGAGYDTSRLGPDNANCNRQVYQLDITSNNVVYKDVDSNANQVGISSCCRTHALSGWSADVHHVALPNVPPVNEQPHGDVRESREAECHQHVLALRDALYAEEWGEEPFASAIPHSRRRF